MIYEKTKQQNLLYEIARNTNWDVLLTLTFPWVAHRKTQDKITSTINSFFKHVENKCYGRQAINSPVQRFIVLEYSVSEGSHLHLLLVKPEDKTHDEFRSILREKWQRLDGTGKQNMANKSKFYLPITDSQEDQKNVIDYINKSVEGNYETVLFQCM